MFGALGGVLPLRLGGTAENGQTAAQHARACADLLAVYRTAPFASWNYTKSGGTVTITSYIGRNGVGLAHAPAANVNGTGDVTFRWVDASGNPYHVYENELGELIPFMLRTADAATPSGATARKATVTVAANSVRVRTFAGSGSGAAVDTTTTVEVWGDPFLATRAIGDYGGDLEKEDSETEGRAPYAAHILRELQEQRGTAYTTTPGRLVDVENVALARFLAATGPRLAEKLRANATPGRSDERLDYWRRYLAVPNKPGEPRWRTRQKLAAHYRVAKGATREEVTAALEELLGDIFVSVSWDEGASLSVPPTPTYWPDINPGPAASSLGGGAWLSTRAHLFVLVQIPAGLSVGEFLTAMNVDMPQLLDRMLPATKTFGWATSDGFILDGDPGSEIASASFLDFDGMGEA